MLQITISRVVGDGFPVPLKSSQEPKVLGHRPAVTEGNACGAISWYKLPIFSKLNSGNYLIDPIFTTLAMTVFLAVGSAIATAR
ncbi:MAG: hypothetical protein IJB91_05960 [Oscillospiraceae bacterium]|nr:hypothetical protein [Oscillospiraceae bacterium]